MILPATRPLLLAASLCSIGSAQTVTETYRLMPSNPPPSGSDVFGISLRMDGDRAIVSDPTRAAVIFEVGSNTELLELDAQGEPDDNFGASVALSGDLAVVGATNVDGIGPLFGSNWGGAWVFDAATGAVLDFIQGSDAVSGDRAGNAVAVNDDYIILAARLQDSPGSQQGAVYVYDAATRQELYKLTAFDGELLDYFGSDVALAGDTLLVGASGDDSNRGAAYLYDLPTGNLIRKIVASDGEPEDFFGVAVAISGDRALVGAYWDENAGGPFAGAAYIFDWTTGQELHKLTASDGAAEAVFGASVDLVGDRAIVGAYLADAPLFRSGAAYTFDASTGQELQKLVPSTPATSDWFGYDVATNGAQDLASLTGGLFFGSPLTEGAVCVYGFPEIGTNYCAAAVNSTGFAAALGATGSSSVTANDLVLEGVGLPTNAFGFFLASRAQGFTQSPGSSQGNLCLGGAIGRYVGPGQIQSSGPLGRISLAIDNTQVPQPSGAVSVQPGETWNFQLWHRDSVGGSVTSNFTDGYEIVFQ